MFENLTLAGQYSISFSKDGFVSNSGMNVVVELGSTTNVENVTLRSLTSTVSGLITLEGSDDCTGVSILLKAKDDSQQYDGTTDNKGHYTINGVIPGQYDLYASKTGFGTSVLYNLVVESATIKTLDAVHLLAKIKSVTGRVALEGKDDYAGALITATNLSDEELVYSAISNSDGYFTLAGMAAGEYRIVVTNTNYRSATLRTIQLIDDPITVDTVNLSIARGTIYGTVTLEGRSDYSGVEVELLSAGDSYKTMTDSNGDYSFYVPQGNYAGVRFSKPDFTTETSSTVISLFAENNVPVENMRLTATHVSVIGSVSVSKAIDNAGVKVSFDDFNAEPVVTSADGAFRFDHVPVGTTYTLRFERDNTATITVRVETKASDGISVKDVVMVPDAAGVEGIVRLDTALNNSGVNVSIDTGKEILTTTTNYAGIYYIGGIPIGREFTVRYSKDGWVSESRTISTLEPLEVRKLEDVSLFDVTEPELNGIELNGGANVSGSRLISVLVDANDKGSGIAEMRYYWNGDSSSAKWVAYNRMFKTEIPENSNARYTLTLEVRDGAGNVCASTKSDSIELVGQVTTIEPGILSGDNLHWQAKDNPIVIMGDITVPQDQILVIDPGVDVVFNGYYSIRVLGKIQAIGTESQPIVFDSTKNYLSESYQVEGFEGYDGYWGGIHINSDVFTVTDNGDFTYSFVDGSILSHCYIYDLSNGISGKVFIDHCRIETQKSAVGKYWDGSRFNGYLLNSYISGGVVAADVDDRSAIVGNIFDGAKLLDEPVFEYQNYYFSGTNYNVSKVWHEYEWDNDGNYISHDIYEFDFNGILLDGYTFVNNKVQNYNALMFNPRHQLQFNTFDSCRSIRLQMDDNEDYYRFNEFINTQDTLYVKAGGKVIGSNDGRYLSYSPEYDNRTISAELNLTEFLDGQIELTFIVIDFAGNETSRTRTVSVEKTFPSVKTIVFNKQAAIYVKTLVSDVSRITSIKIYADDILLGEDDVSRLGSSWTSELTKAKTDLPEGEYSIKVVLENNLGETRSFNSEEKVTIGGTPFVENNLEGMTTISGILNDEGRLHWTTDMSPVVITGNITVASGKTLVIDPGVEVLFEGNYSITVRGSIRARGTAENPIVFRSSAANIENHEGYYGTWKGISLSDSMNSMNLHCHFHDLCR